MANQRSIEAGRGHIAFSLQDRLVARGLRQLRTNLAAIGRELTILGTAGLGAASGFFAAAAFPTQLAADLQETTAEFQAMTGSAEDAARIIAELEEFSKISIVPVGALQGAARTLLGYGVSAENAVDVTRALTAVSRGSSDRLNRLSLAFGQVEAKGRLMAQEVRQFVEAGLNPLQILAESSGKSVAELEDAMAEGAVTARDVGLALQIATTNSGRFATFLEEVGETASGLFKRLTASVRLAIRPIGVELLGAIEDLLRAALELVPAFAEFIRENARYAVTAAQVALGVATASAAILGLGVSLIATSALINATSNVLALLLSPISAVVSAFTGLFGAFGLVGRGAAGVLGSLLPLVAGVGGLARSFVGVGASLGGALARGLGGAAAVITGALSGALRSALLNALLIIGPTISGAGGLVTGAFGAVASGVGFLIPALAAAGSAFLALLPVMGSLAVAAPLLAGGYFLISRAMTVIPQLAAQVGAALRQGFDGVVETVTSVAGEIVTAFREGFASVSEDVQAAVGIIVDLIASGQIEAAGQLAMATLRLAFAEGLEPIRLLFSEWLTTINAAWIGFTTGLQTAWINTTTAIANAFDTYVVGYFAGSFLPLLTRIAGGINDLLLSVAEAASTIFSAFGFGFDELIAKAREANEEFKKSADGIQQNAFDRVDERNAESQAALAALQQQQNRDLDTNNAVGNDRLDDIRNQADEARRVFEELRAGAEQLLLFPSQEPQEAGETPEINFDFLDGLNSIDNQLNGFTTRVAAGTAGFQGLLANQSTEDPVQREILEANNATRDNTQQLLDQGINILATA